ncbi:MAG TPA: glycosyltransferase family 4 protein [Chitinophagales bacterium]|nr:glycosyltransferase family 4 protein [Chitinophagales bacterium]
MKRKSIFIVSTEFLPGPGGIGSHAYQVAKELHKLGWQVIVFSEQGNCGDEEIEEFNRQSPFKVFRLFPTPSMVLLIMKLLKLVWASITQRPGVILGTGKHGAWFAALTGKLTFTPTALIGHGTEFIVTMSDRSKKINDWVFNSAGAIVYVSNYTKQIAEQAGVYNKNAHVLHNGGDDALFYPVPAEQTLAFKKAKGIDGQKIILTVGNVQPRKGHEFVIRAMPDILKAIPDAHYYCVGPPTIKPYLEGVAKEMNVSQAVHFPGRVLEGELLQWMNACDVFALTSVATDYGDIEGFGIVIIEAALCKKPAVVTSESGPGEAISEGVTGLGVKEKDSKAIAEKIISLLDNDDLRNNMGENAYQNALANLTWTRVVKKYDEVLSALL